MKNEFYPRVKDFKPELIFWYFGFDTHQGDYGSLGLSGRCFQEIARFMKNTAEEITGGRLEVVLGGDDFPAELAERYGYINRALPAEELGPFVEELALLGDVRVDLAAQLQVVVL